ncbi:MAG: GNAT family N-acetyltransferase [Deltaproteobacteria bacterium]|nr:GNAT family N-acetyltransferase [Deltaproteobacteria bacterium]
MLTIPLRPLRILRSQRRYLSLKDVFVLLKNAFFRSDEILIYRKDLDSMKGCSKNDGDISIGRVDELEYARRKIPSPPWEFYCHIYDRVTDFFLYKAKNGEIAHISWIYKKGDPNRIIDLGPQESEIKYSLTFPEFRGKGIYPAVLFKIQDHLRDKGVKRVFICVHQNNTPSIKGIQKAGFTFLAKIKLIKLLGFQINRKFSS